MSGKFEQDLKCAFDMFIAQVTEAAERAALETVQSVLGRVAKRSDVGSTAQPTKRSDVATTVEMAKQNDVRAVPNRPVIPATHVDHSEPTPAAPSTTSQKLIAHIRDNPGSTLGQLGSSLGIQNRKLRSLLRRLRGDGKIRVAWSGDPYAKKRDQRYFVVELAVEQASAAPSESLAAPTGSWMSTFNHGSPPASDSLYDEHAEAAQLGAEPTLSICPWSDTGVLAIVSREPS